jgi:acyl carrier protein
MTPTDETRVRTFLLQELIKDEEMDLTPDEPLFSSGLLDSFVVTQLICFLEDEFSIKIRAGDVTLHDFDTIAKILALTRKQQAAPR